METDENRTNDLREILDSLNRSRSGKVLSASVRELDVLSTIIRIINQSYISFKRSDGPL
jgi:hypothetical protein